MGGKAKQSQRTKNNVRPSSSGRSAELLNNVIKTDNVFGSLSPGKGLTGLFPTMAAGPLDQLASNEYTLAFKKLNKKDPITRTKALHELLELVKNSDIEDVVAALPNWAHFYLMLTIDSERKVREATQACHGLILSRCGRRAGPHVRRLLPAWLLAQHDEYAPAQALANQHLHATFPDHKLGDAITFCKSEIMSLITDNLTGNAEAILNKKIDDPEERKLQVSRVISSSLRALDMFVSRLAPEHDEWLLEQLQALFSNSFWKIANHESHHVRAAWFTALGRLVDRLGSALGPALGPLARALLAAPDARARAAAPRWAALLLLLYKVPDWHVWLKNKDLLVKRLIDTLENGGCGDASLLSNVLLPLLSKLPDELLTKQFYLTFFNAFFTGLQIKTILNSKSERQSWITNLAECLRYLSIQKHDFVIEIVSHVHRTWLEKIFAIPDDTTRDHLIKISAQKMAAMVKYWIKQTAESTDDVYDKLVRNFWQNFGVIVVTQIENVPVEDEDISKLIHTHTLLFKALKAKSEAKKSIRFEGDVTNETEPIEEAVEYEKNVLEAFEHSLNECVSKACSAYFEYADKKQMSRSVFPPLLSIIISFESESLFLGIARSYNTNTLYLFYDKVLRGWLASDTMRCKALAEIVFMISKYLNDEELEAMYNSFQHLSPVAVEWCISLSLSLAHRTRTAGARWLRGDVVQQALVALCKRGDDEANRLLLTCLAQDTGGSTIPPHTTRAIVSHVSLTLSHTSGSELATRAQFGAALCRALGASTHAHDLLVTLFLLNLTLLPKEPDTEEGEEETDETIPLASISASSWRELLHAWHQAVCALAPVDRLPLVDRAVKEIQGKLRDNHDALDIPIIEHIVSICPYLVDFDNVTIDNSELIQITKQLLNIDITHSETAVLVYALRKDIVYGKLTCPIDDGHIMKKVLEIANTNSTKDLATSDVVAYVNKVVFRAAFLKEIVTRSKELDGSLFDDEFFRLLFVDVLYDFTVVSSLCEVYAFVSIFIINKLLGIILTINSTVEQLEYYHKVRSSNKFYLDTLHL
ncbi:E3 ubiquitin-protein ligase listerin-like [Colias croceus]|uniref:E3 ubiquitin-protein ligase listerin-like n=1 Tax=Colias crocea TaxID=72248 RepID=UPI001E27A029|nr:E3 ubiquitin-protein ligase listerin-like [Colias croceus]